MNRTYFAWLGLTLTTVALWGCSRAEQNGQRTDKTGAANGSVQVVLLGDATRIELFNQLAAANNTEPKKTNDLRSCVATIDGRQVTITASDKDEVVSQGGPLSSANLAVIAVDARNGPTPIHKDHIPLAKQRQIPQIMVVITHSNKDDIADAELLELEELEMRELLTAHGWKGDEAIVAYDSETAVLQGPQAPKGMRALSSVLAKAGE